MEPIEKKHIPIVDLEDCKTGFESSSSDLHGFCSLEKKRKLMLSMKEASQKLNEERLNLKRVATDLIDKISENDTKPLISNIDHHLGNIEKVFSCNCHPATRNMLYFGQYKDKRHFLCDLIVRLHNEEKIFSCEMIGNVGWKYGRVTFSNDRIHIHCLSLSTPEEDSSLVMLQDLKRCLVSTNIVPFICVGDQKLYFKLKKDMSISTLHVIKLCTGEAEQVLKGKTAEISKFNADNNFEHISNSDENNCCRIYLGDERNGVGYEQALFRRNKTRVYKGDIIIQCLKNILYIYKVPQSCFWHNVVGKLHEDCSINFEEMIGMKTEDCGISFGLD